MLINNETDYAFRILRALADGEKHTMKDLCEQEAIPQQFAYKIIRKLSAGGIVKSTRGVNGGVRLAADLHDITMLDIVELTDSERYLTDCMRPHYQCSWMDKNCERCSVHARLHLIQKKLDEEMSRHSLYDMVAHPEVEFAAEDLLGEEEEPEEKARTGTSSNS